jgi:3-dehydroquinate synthase
MIIKSSTKDYQVNIYNNFDKAKSIEVDKNTFVVIDKILYGLYEKELFSGIPEDQLYIIEAIEENKTIETALAICEIMTNIPAKRNAKLISFGGGIVQDVTGFVANILYRGIHWTFYPTTLLAACDSCIGGKTSLNYKSFKNLLGTFYPPDEINICTPFFKTLSERDFQSGLGEVVKFNVMFGEQGIVNMENNIDALLRREDDKLEEFVESSLAFKKDFIEEDEFDRGVRIHLNFAHTFGHAFETMSHYAIPHGTAVAMGTIVANRISLSRGWLTEDKVFRVEQILWKIIHIDAKHIQVDMDEVISAIHKDKKQVGKELTAVLMKDDMKLQIVHDVKRDEIEEAITYVFGHLRENQ